ncbi:cytochrome P450 [Heliocybe sulcata]|uniref:Cytochrome P450 n=1 Tax=Heliocybe sulcata TaxID=5364 RepID=A0A5C3NK36_9AGAM|nr:cytochrome P450 [Heliocybe sulcata]
MSLLHILLLFPLLVGMSKLIRRSFTSTGDSFSQIAGPASEHWIKGNYHRIFQDGFDYNLRLAHVYGGVAKIHAMFGGQQLYVSDPRALHHMLIKEPHVFEETDMFIMGNGLIFGEGLISTTGDQHRKQRRMVKPAFSTANLRALAPKLQRVAHQLCAILRSQLDQSPDAQEIDILPWINRCAFEYVSTACLGRTFNALTPNESNEYVEAVRNLAPQTLRLLFLRPLIPSVVRHFSPSLRCKLSEWLPMEAFQNVKRLVDIMHRCSLRISAEKRSMLSEIRDGAEGSDIMSILLRTNEASVQADQLSDAELVAQMNTFIFGGLETTTSTICRILHILAIEDHVQSRLRNEIRQAKMDYASEPRGKAESCPAIDLPYDVLMNLPYLDAVVKETLRVYPPTSLLSRTARQASALPLAKPVQSA